jgi:hypothetical protein
MHTKDNLVINELKKKLKTWVDFLQVLVCREWLITENVVSHLSEMGKVDWF